MINAEPRKLCPLEIPLNPVNHTQVLNTRMGRTMKSLMQIVASHLKQRMGLMPIASSEGTTDVIISGFSTSVDSSEPTELDRRPVGILYADIAEYARLTEEDEEGTHLRLVESMEILKALVVANNGRVAHLAGDAILAEFKDADSALHCAINAQLSARQWNANLALNQQVQFRIGVNFGDVISDNGDIFGKAVNIAARLESLACSGGICVSNAVRLELEGASAFRFVAMGKQYVKNISEPVQAFWIEIDAQQVVDADFTGAIKVSPIAHE